MSIRKGPSGRISILFRWFNFRAWLAALSALLAILIVYFWIHGRPRPDGLPVVDTAVFRRAGLAIGSWRGRIALSRMYEPRYRMWNGGGINDPGLFNHSIEFFESVGGESNWENESNINDLPNYTGRGFRWDHLAFWYASYDVRKLIDVDHDPRHVQVKTQMLAVPDYFLLILFSIAPALWMRRKIIARHRIRSSRCIQCGYDLRATPTRCPECGQDAAIR